MKRHVVPGARVPVGATAGQLRGNGTRRDSAVPGVCSAGAFTTWTGPVTRALVEMGVPAKRAGSLATLMISALEGAILIARAEQDVRALTTVARELGPLLDSATGEGG